MDRPLIYPMEVPNSSDLLYGWQRTMVALSKLAQATLGTGTWVTDFSATPGAGLSVTLGPAQAFIMGPVDATAYGSIPADSNQILKQYLLDGYQTISLTAPATSGDAVNYLLQLTPVDEDTGDVVLQYFDPANPDVAFGGPNNSGAAQATERLNTLQVQLISGATAPAGSQPTPTLTGIAGVVITVTAGQTSIVASNIVYAAGSAPYVPQKLPDTAVTNLNNFFTASQNITGDLSVSGTASIANGVAGNIAGKSTGYQPGGLTVAWNYTDGQGEVDLLLGPQGGAGGLNIYALNSTGDFTGGTPIFALTSTGALSLSSTLTVAGTASAAAGTTGNELVNISQFVAKPFYTQNWDGSYQTSVSESVQSAAIIAQEVVFPAYSKTGGFRVQVNMILSGNSTAVGNQNYYTSMVDTQGFSVSGVPWLQNFAATGISWGISDTVFLNKVYTPGEQVTFTVYLNAYGGAGTSTIENGGLQLMVFEA